MIWLWMWLLPWWCDSFAHRAPVSEETTVCQHPLTHCGYDAASSLLAVCVLADIGRSGWAQFITSHCWLTLGRPRWADFIIPCCYEQTQMGEHTKLGNPSTGTDNIPEATKRMLMCVCVKESVSCIQLLVVSVWKTNLAVLYYMHPTEKYRKLIS